MDNLLSIGRFAQLTRLTVKALRLYDTMGLLPPAAVDIATGYRYYHLEQIAIAERIRLLRALDMPLIEIQALLGAGDADAVRAHLIRHQRRIVERIDSYRHALRLLHTLDDVIVTPKEEGMNAPIPTNVIHCSFCGKERTQMRRMIAGPNGVFICNECVRLCNAIIAEHTHDAEDTDEETRS